MHVPAEFAAEILARLRARRPRVHCITNSVVQQYTANMLLAAGELAADEGGFAAAIIDALYGLDRATLRQRAKVS